MNPLILYGTLRCGQLAFQQYKLIDRLEYVKDVTFKGTLLDLGQWPGFIEEGNGIVYGEMYNVVDKELLAALDKHENFDPTSTEPFNETTHKGSMYLRRAVTCTDGTIADIYIYNGWIMPNGKPAAQKTITSGDWILHTFHKNV